MLLLKSIPVVVILLHIASGWNYGGGGGGGGYDHGWQDKIPSKIIIKHVPKHVPVYKPVPIPKHVPVPKPVGYLKPLAIAKPFKVPQIIPVIKHLQKPFPVLKGIPFHFPIPLPKFVKLPFNIKIPKPYVVRVPKPYAVAKKFPVAVPVHIPKPYIVPILKHVPVGVPQKIPKIVPIVKEVPEYVKKPVPVYIEEQPYKHEGNYKGSPYPSDQGNYKGSPLPPKGTPYPSGGDKGTPYIPSGKGGNSGGGYHGKGSSINPTSAASFLAAHAGKLQSQQGSSYNDMLASFSQGHSYGSFQGLGGGIHGGYHGLNGYSDFQSFGGNFQDFQGPYASGAQDHGNYVPNNIYSEGYESLSSYGRGASSGVAKESDNGGDHYEGYGQRNVGYENGADGSISYDNGHSAQSGANEGQGSKYDSQGYSGGSVNNYNDHSGRGGGYTGESSGGYNVDLNKDGENNGYQNQGYNSGTENHNTDAGYEQKPTLALFQLQNGAVAPLNYPQANSNYYNTGYQTQNNYQEQGHNANQEYSGYESQVYSQNENIDTRGKGPIQQSSYGYQSQLNFPEASQQNEQGYQPQNPTDSEYENKEIPQQDQNNYGDQNSAYESQGSYGDHGSSKVYHNQASYYINHAPAQGNDAGYGNQDVASNLQNYGLKAAYAVQPGKETPATNLQGASGTVYMRAYDQTGNQVSYNVHNTDNFQAQDSQPVDIYASEKAKSSDEPDEKEDQPVLKGRSFDSKEQLVGDSSGYSTQEGGDTKGGSWKAVH